MMDSDTAQRLVDEYARVRISGLEGNVCGYIDGPTLVVKTDQGERFAVAWDDPELLVKTEIWGAPEMVIEVRETGLKAEGSVDTVTYQPSYQDQCLPPSRG